jgi:hypothetical protein
MKEKSIKTVLKEMPLWLWAVLIILSPIIIFFLILSLSLTLLLLPFVMLGSIKYGKGETYFGRLKNNISKTFSEIFKSGDIV